MQEFQKSLFQRVEIIAIGAHVIGIDVGDHRDVRLQAQEGRIAFVRFGHQPLTSAKTRVTFDALDQPANEKCRVEARDRKNTCHQTGGGGLAMSAGNRDAVAKPHQFTQHLGPGHHRNAEPVCLDHLRVVGSDRTRGDHHVRGSDTGCFVADNHGSAIMDQAARSGRFHQVRPSDLVTLVQ